MRAHCFGCAAFASFSLFVELETRAQLVFQDSFSYPSGQNLTSVSVSPWTSSGTGNELAVVNGSLATPGLQNPVGNSIALSGPGKTDSITFTPQSTSTFYSFALDVLSLGTLGTNGGYFAGFTDGGSGLGCVVWLRRSSSNPNNFDLGLSVRDTPPIQWNLNEGVGWAPGEYHIFGLYDVGINGPHGTSDTADLWINRWNNGGDLSPTYGGQPIGSALQVAFAPDLSQVGGFFFAQGAGPETPSLVVDELRVGKTWADVTPVPEPNIEALTILALLFVLIVRRNHTSESTLECLS